MGRGATRGRETLAGCPPQQMRWRERGSLAAVAAVVAVVVVAGAVTSGQQPLSDPLGPLQPRPPLTSPATYNTKKITLLPPECVIH